MAGAPERGGGIELEAGPNEAGTRLDRLLADRLPDLSRARVQRSCARRRHQRGADLREPGHRVKPGERFTVALPPVAPSTVRPEPIALDIVYEDAHLVVLDKPAGLVVHPAAGHASGTLVNALVAHCGDGLSGIGGEKRPGIVHRLDKDTSGLLVVAKTDAAHRGLAEQFAAHGADGRLARAYVAVVWGVPERPSGTIAARLARSVANRRKIAVVGGEAGRHAVTRYRVLQAFDTPRRARAASLLRLELETGRTHRSASTWPMPAIRSSETPSTARVSRRARSCSAARRRPHSPTSAGRRCTPPNWASSTPSAESVLTSRARRRPLWQT